MLPQDALWNELQQQQPDRLLVYSDDKVPALTLWSQEHNRTLTYISTPEELEPLTRFDLAIVLDWQINSKNAAQILARIRNLHSHKIWLLSASNSQQPEPSLIGLGFKRERVFDDLNLSSYGYNLDNYNRRREWNSPKHWANPENWGRYWW